MARAAPRPWLLEQGVGAAETRASLHHLVGRRAPGRRCLRPRGPRAAGGSRAEPPRSVRRRSSGRRIAAQSARACVRARSIARRQASARRRAAADGQETVEAGEVGASGLVEEDAGRRGGGRDPDGVGQRVQAVSDAGEGLPDVAERPVPAAHGREYRNRPGRGQRGLSSHARSLLRESVRAGSWSTRQERRRRPSPAETRSGTAPTKRNGATS